MQQFQDSVDSAAGPAIQATITVTDANGAIASIFIDNSSTPKTNPFTTDSLGMYDFYAANGKYTVTVSATGYSSYSKSIILYDYLDSLMIDVKGFGAKGNDDDDTTAVQSAINVGKRLFFPPGIYTVGNLTITDSIELFSGVGAVIKKKAGTSGDLITITTTDAEIVIDRIIFDGNYSEQTSLQTASIVSMTSTNSTLRVKDSTFRNQEYVSIEINGGSDTGEYSELFVNGCKFIDGQEGTASFGARYISTIGTVSSFIDNNLFDRNGTPSISGIAGVQYFNANEDPLLLTAAVTNNDFVDVGRCASNRLGCVQIYSGSANVIVTGNRLKRVFGRGIEVKSNCKRAVVSNNVIEIVVAIDGVPGQGITMSATADDVTQGANYICEGNIITDSDGNGILMLGNVSGDTYKFKNLVISDNIVDTCTLDGIRVDNVDGVVINGNKILNASGSGISVRDSSNDIVCNNNIVIGGGFGINMANNDPTLVDLIASGNIVRDTASSGIIVGTGSSGVRSFNVTGNTITGALTGAGVTFINQTAMSNLSGNIFKGNAADFLGSGSFVSAFNNITDARTGPTTLTIASGIITVRDDVHSISTEGAASTDDLVTINGGYVGRKLILVASSDSNDVVLKDGTGNLKLAGDCTLSHSNDTISLIYDRAVWKEISRSINAA